MPICPKCQTITEGNYCYKDGTKTVPKEKCKCLRELHPADKFCPDCGRPVQGGSNEGTK